MKTIASPLLLLLLSLFPLAAPAAAQEARDAQGTFSDTLEVQAVDVEVLVTDREGDPVPGLKAADFRLLVDGKEVPVEYFAEVQEGISVTQAPAVSGGAAVPPPPALADSDRVGNHYLVFVDEFFTPLAMRNEAMAALAREAALMRPQDRMAVVSYDGRRLTILSPWTGPGEPLQKFLARLAEHKGSYAATPFSIAELEASANELIEVTKNRLEGEKDGEGSMVDPVLTEKREARYLERSIEAATATLRSFAGVSGRKLLVLLSGGWNYEAYKQGKKTAKRFERLQPLMDTCNLLGYTIYPIHLSQDGASVLPRAGTGAVSASAGIGYSSGEVGGPQHAGLLAVAEETGGKLLLPGANNHLSRIAADTRSYYWLGFTHSGEPKSRTIQVQVSRPGLEVRSRKSFLPLTQQERLDLDMERVLLTGDSRGMGPLEVSVGKFKRVGRKVGELPITVRVPVESLTLSRQGSRYRGKLELRIAALDSDGNRSEIPLLPIDIDNNEPPTPGAVIRYDTRIRVRDAAQEVQLILHDKLSGKSFAERVRVQP
ncbi:MAG TPA: VWA domain-containing protein [Thermoanaerobaculia bacterium]|nr:VWA domain-containing protein [Thermoanaerobaculia bacterium]